MKLCASVLAATVLIGLLTACELGALTEAKPAETKHIGALLLASHPVIVQLKDGFTNRLAEIARTVKISIEFDKKKPAEMVRN